MRIYEGKKPKLGITLQTGGSLAANTTYYLLAFGCCSSPNWREGGAQTPLSDLYTFNTDSTKKQVSVEFYWEGNIESVADNGGGTVKITSTRHGIPNGAEITISGTTNYNGTYTILWESYNEFIITAAWAGDETGAWKMLQQENANFRLVHIYLDTSDPTSGDFFDFDGWQQRDFSYYSTTSPFTIDSDNVQAAGHQNSLLKESVSSYTYRKNTGTEFPGRLYIVVDSDHGSNFWQDLLDELDAAGVTNYYEYNDNLGYLFLSAHVDFAIGSVSQTTYKKITLDGILRAYYLTEAENNVFSYCSIDILWGRRPNISGTFGNCLICDRANEGGYYKLAILNDTAVDVRGNFILYAESNKTDEGLSITFHDSNNYLWYVYPLSDHFLKDITITNGYFYLYDWWGDATRETTTINGLTFKGDREDRDIRYYDVGTLHDPIPLINVKMDRDNTADTYPLIDRYSGTSRDQSFELWNSRKFIIYDPDGNLLQGATVTITDKDGTEYTDTTDENGEAEIFYKVAFDEGDGTQYGSRTTYAPFTCVVSYTGYDNLPINGNALLDVDITEVFGEMKKKTFYERDIEIGLKDPQKIALEMKETQVIELDLQ